MTATPKMQEVLHDQSKKLRRDQTSRHVTHRTYMRVTDGLLSLPFFSISFARSHRYATASDVMYRGGLWLITGFDDKEDTLVCWMKYTA